jgi:hypothetical protein
MAGVYKFTISLPVNDTLARNRFTNTVHFEHVTGGQSDDQLRTMCTDIAAMYQKRYGNLTKEVQVKAYDTDAVPNYPRADVVVNAGQAWTCTSPPEVALCLSFAGAHRGNKRERGRIYLAPAIGAIGAGGTLRPSAAHMTWALAFYTTPNESFPDIGGVDWKFGIWSKVGQKFTQATQAWVNDDWDHVGKRSTRESTRQSVTREG